MGWRKELITTSKDKDRVIDKLNIRLTQLQEENEALKQNLQLERVTAAAEMEVVLCEYDSILTEKKGADKKLLQLERVVCELKEGNLCQRNQIDRLQEKVQMQRRTIWGVVSSLFVVAAASLAYAVSPR